MSAAGLRMSGSCHGIAGRSAAALRLPYRFLAPTAGALTGWNRLMTAQFARSLGLTLALLGAAPVVASPLPMAQETHINDELRAGFAGDTLRKTCPTISARMLVVMKRLWDLKSYAEAQGYTAADYDAFRSDPVQKKRLKAEAQAYLEKAGAKPGDVDSYCRVGESEIAKGTALGTLIRSSK